jgi:RimJ/RimL family protein N-acetyltransferase
LPFAAEDNAGLWKPVARGEARRVKKALLGTTLSGTDMMTFFPMILETARLQLHLHSPENHLALLESAAKFEGKFGMPVAAGLRDFYTSGEVSPAWLERLRTATVADPWEHGFAVVPKDQAMVIGGAGFAGPPSEQGAVEIAYGIAPGFQGRGYATEVAGALVQFAINSGRVRLVYAHTRPTPSASTRVLTKCGFTRGADVMHPEDGLVWRWERIV